MTQTLTIALTESEMQLLRKQAALDCRRPQEQARFLLRSVLFTRQESGKENTQCVSPEKVGAVGVSW